MKREKVNNDVIKIAIYLIVAFWLVMLQARSIIFVARIFREKKGVQRHFDYVVPCMDPHSLKTIEEKRFLYYLNYGREECEK